MTGRTLSSLAIGGLTSTGASKVIEGVAQLIVLAVLARLLDAADFGILSAVLVIAGIASMSYQLGVGPALIQKERVESDHLSSGFWFTVMLSGAIAFGVILLRESLATAIGIPTLAPYIYAISFVFLIEGLAVVSTSMLSREYKFRYMAIANSLSYIIGYMFVGIGCAWYGLGAWSLIIAHMTRAGINSVFMICGAFPRTLTKFRLKALGEILWYGGGFTIGRLLNYAATQGDNVIVARMMGPSSLGIYSRAYQLLVMPASLFGKIVDRVLFPILSGVQSDGARVGRAYLKCITGIATIMIPISVICVLNASEVIWLVLGESWDEAVVPFQVLALGMAMRTGYKVSDVVVRALGDVYKRAIVQGMYALLVFVGSVVGAIYLGLFGVALSTVVAMTVNFASLNYLVQRRANITLQKMLGTVQAGVVLGTMCGICSGLLTVILRSMGASPAVILMFSIAVAGVACAGVVVIVNRMYNPTGREEWWVVAKGYELVRGLMR